MYWYELVNLIICWILVFSFQQIASSSYTFSSMWNKNKNFIKAKKSASSTAAGMNIGNERLFLFFWQKMNSWICYTCCSQTIPILKFRHFACKLIWQRRCSVYFPWCVKFTDDNHVWQCRFTKVSQLCFLNYAIPSCHFWNREYIGNEVAICYALHYNKKKHREIFGIFFLF